MPELELLPVLKTAGGEVCDIMLDDVFAGTLSLVYREGDRLFGSVQLEEESLTVEDKESVISYLEGYIQSMIYAVQASACDVLVTYSSYDRIITTGEDEVEAEDDRYGRSDDALVMSEYDEDLSFDDEEWDEVEFELVTIEENETESHYHIYDTAGDWIAEAHILIDHADVAGEVNWQFEPEDIEIEWITELLVSDFDEDTVDTFVVNHKFEGDLLETIELTHEDLLDELEDDYNYLMEEDYNVVLARDDGDVLTYEIYQQSRGGLPIGTATVDIQHQRLTGFVDFREKGVEDDVEIIAALLMRELDKEKEFEGLNLTLMYQNEPIDELIIDNETVQ